jgi:hypothetical protein
MSWFRSGTEASHGWSNGSAWTQEACARRIPRGKVGEGFRIETHTDTHAIIVVGGRKSLLNWFGGRGAGSRYVVSVDQHGVVTMIPAEPRRN